MTDGTEYALFDVLSVVLGCFFLYSITYVGRGVKWLKTPLNEFVRLEVE